MLVAPALKADLKHIHDFIAEDPKHYAKKCRPGDSRENGHYQRATQYRQNGPRSAQARVMAAGYYRACPT